MKENVVDILIYLFENYIDTEYMSLPDDNTRLSDELEDAGFSEQNIHKAFRWLDTLTQFQLEGNSRMKESFRVYHPLEISRLGPECLSFLGFLEESGLINEVLKEIIIDRALALDSFAIELDQLKWVCLFVIYRYSLKPQQESWLEELLFLDTRSEALH